MQNPEDYKDYQILGANLQTILDGFGSFTLLASKILLEAGLGTIDDEGIGLAKLDPAQWYPVPNLLRAWERIQTEFGEFTIKQAGLHIAKRAKQVSDAHFQNLETAFKLMDAGYLINHAKNGVPMFNPQTGQAMEGIGHYRLRPGANKNQLIFDVDALYPCAFAAGIVEGVALIFDPKAKMTHDPKMCRKRGAPICTYTVTYNPAPAPMGLKK
jgi:hypothetical protein